MKYPVVVFSTVSKKIATRTFSPSNGQIHYIVPKVDCILNSITKIKQVSDPKYKPFYHNIVNKCYISNNAALKYQLIFIIKSKCIQDISRTAQTSNTN